MHGIIEAQIAGMNYTYCHYPFDFFLDSMTRLGIRNIELWGGSPHFYTEDFTCEMIRGVKKQISSRGLNLVCFTPCQAVYPVNIAAKESYLRDRSIRYMIKSIEAAVELESPLVIVGAGWGYLSESKADAWKRSQESLGIITRNAERLGVTLALEPYTTISSNLINYASELKQMLMEVGSPVMKGMLDVGQMAILNERIEDYFGVLGKDLVHIHFVDGRPTGHMAFGDGTLPLSDYLHKIIEIGYARHLSMEINDRQYFIEPEMAVKQSLDMLEKWLESKNSKI